MATLPSSNQTVSVIIPAYNMAEYLSAAIASVLNNTYRDIDVICVDDGSTDETPQVARSFTDPDKARYDPRVRYMYQNNRGKSAAVNTGIDAMEGAYLTVLDADDQLSPYSIESRVSKIENSESADFVIGSFAVIDEEGRQVGETRMAPTDPLPESLRHSFYLSYKTPFHFNACLLRRNLVERVGPFDVDLIRCQDGDYAIRSLQHARGVVTIDDVVYLYRKHRDDRKDRTRMRLATLRHRPVVLIKNFSPPRNYIYAGLAFALDTAKLFYEVFSNYRN